MKVSFLVGDPLTYSRRLIYQCNEDDVRLQSLFLPSFQKHAFIVDTYEHGNKEKLSILQILFVYL